ncbi:MAG: creatininase family protein [Gemmatimonadota bacterium]|jgi:creatinine amidohydrolase/Fe(II)-dependent formamide hydrolase-like protein
MRWFIMAVTLSAVTPINAIGQILQVAELSVRDIEQLDRNQTVVILRGGVLEEHGPYLPSFTDGYLNEWLAQRTAEAILAARGGTVLMFPIIPLGVGSPEDFGGLPPFSGSYTVRPETLRAVYMDLSSALGRDGFRTIFVFNRHGSPSHNWALLEAADYFNDRFDGTMVVLTSLVYSGTSKRPQVWSSDEQAENRGDVHAGAGETSQNLFLQPKLVHDDYKSAEPQTASSLEALVDIARKAGWPGYFGSPRVASPGAGARLVEHRTEQTIELALRILDGFDWRSLPTRADRSALDSSFRTLDDNTLARSEEERRSQEDWNKARTQ